jgi:hypothetical protein
MDTADTGRRVVLGGSWTNVRVSADFAISALSASGYQLNALLARYVDWGNHAQLTIQVGNGYADSALISLHKVIGGSYTQLASSRVPLSADKLHTFGLDVLQDGTALIHRDGAVLATVNDSVFAAGGTLATGKVGMYDESQQASAYVRTFKDFAASPPTDSAVIFPGRALQLSHEQVRRESSDGEIDGRVPVFEGQYLRMPPSTRSRQRGRLVVKRRRYDVDAGAPDVGLDDDLSVGVDLTPRVLLVGGRR